MLTAKQHQLLVFINDRLSNSGVSPSFDEMKDALGLKSKSGVHRLINALEERGFIRRMANRARALEVLKLPELQKTPEQVTSTSFDNVVKADFGSKSKIPADTTVEIPLHGKIAAGTPVEALENHDSFIPVPASMLGRGTYYALEISGDSMIEMGILNGDTVLIENTTTVRDGDVVVALVDREEATLKTLQKNGKTVSLIPANKDYDVQVYEAHRVQVQGRLAGLIRTYH